MVSKFVIMLRKSVNYSKLRLIAVDQRKGIYTASVTIMQWKFLTQHSELNRS